MAHLPYCQIPLLMIVGFLLPMSLLEAAPPPPKEELQVGWLEVRGGLPEGYRVVLRNRGRMPLHYSWSEVGPPYDFFRLEAGEWRSTGRGYCGNAFRDQVLSPGDSLKFLVRPDSAPEGKARIGVSLRRIDSRRWFYAVSEDSLDFRGAYEVQQRILGP